MLRFGAAPLVSFCLLLVGCSGDSNTRVNYSMGEKVPLGKLNYTVVESTWKSQLGQGFQFRSPEQRFLLITLSVNNGGNEDVSIPLLTLEAPDGKTYRESDNGQGVDNWFGLLRTISPSQTQQGRILFDVGLTSYKLKLPSGDIASEKYAQVDIPLSIDSDSQVQAPLPGSQFK